MPEVHGSVGTFPRHGSAVRHHFFYSFSALLVPYLTLSNDLTNTFCPVPVFPWGLTLLSTLPKWPPSHHTQWAALTRSSAPPKWLSFQETSPNHQHIHSCTWASQTPGLGVNLTHQQTQSNYSSSTSGGHTQFTQGKPLEHLAMVTRRIDSLGPTGYLR